MAYSAILIVSIFLLLAFAVERVSALLRLPSVIVLVGLGFIVKPLLGVLGYQLDGVDVLVPVLGAIGLILIVLEGAFDIEQRRDRLPLASLLFYMAVFASLAMLALGWALFTALLLAVPFAIISSAVAIPSSQSDATDAMAVPSLPAYFTGAVLIVVLVSTALVAMARRQAIAAGASTLNSSS